MTLRFQYCTVLSLSLHFKLLSRLVAFQEKVSAKICIVKPILNIYNTFPLSYIPASLANVPLLVWT